MSQLEITVTFEALNGQTRIISRTEFPSASDLKAVLDMGIVEGVTETWDRLEAYLVSV